jgi:hypothetical protein
MDTQLKNYVIYKGSEQYSIAPATLDQCVKAIQILEKSLNRYAEHSPYTIRKKQG